MALLTTLSRKLGTIRRFSLAEIATTARAWGSLAWADCLVSLVPTRYWHRRLHGALAAPRAPTTTLNPVDIRLFHAALRNYPRAPGCLARALAMHGFLHRRGCHTRLVIGVRRENGRLGAHAWLEDGDRIVGDTPDVRERYIPLPQGYDRSQLERYAMAARAEHGTGT